MTNEKAAENIPANEPPVFDEGYLKYLNLQWWLETSKNAICLDSDLNEHSSNLNIISVVIFSVFTVVAFLLNLEHHSPQWSTMKCIAATAFFTMMIFCVIFWFFSTNISQKSASGFGVAVTAISGLYYLLEAANIAPYSKSAFGRDVSILQFGEWIVTVPLLVCALGHVLQVQRNFVLGGALLQLGVMACGLVGQTVSSKIIGGLLIGLSHILYLPFVLFIYLFCFKLSEFVSLSQCNKLQFLGTSVFYVWSLYPVVALLGIGNMISHDTERILYILLDVISKSWFIALLLAYQYQAVVSNLSKKLMHLEKENSAQKVFLRFVFHEVRVPFHSVLLGLDHMMSVDELTNYRSLIQPMLQSAEMMERTINDVLTLSRLEEGKLELVCTPLSVEDVLRSTVNSFETSLNEKNLAIHFTISDNVPMVVGDPHRLSQVIANLLSNAIKFSKDKGSIFLELLMLVQTPTKCSFVLKVRDNGIGMSPEQQEKLFVPFSQIRPHENQEGRGSGLGLSIVKHIVELLDGQISVQSELNKGTEFCVTLLFPVCLDPPPLKTEDVTSSKPAMQSPTEAQSIRKRQIVKQENEKAATPVLVVLQPEPVCSGDSPLALVVDDVATNRKFTGMMLTQQGFIVHEAENGQEAVEKAQMNKYSIIFMDNTMPVMNGIDATREIMKFSTSPIIGLTGNSLDDDVQEFLMAGAVQVLFKPCKRDKLLAALDAHLANRQGINSKEKQT